VASVLYDAYIPGDGNSVAALAAKANAADQEALQVLESTYFFKKKGFRSVKTVFFIYCLFLKNCSAFNKKGYLK
jgi:hypothetical protein